MTTLILPPELLPTGSRVRGSYGSVLAHVVRASFDAEEAVRLFASLLIEADHSGFARFDAHVGDTACHIRAGLLREVYNSCKKANAEGLASWFRTAALQFRHIRKAAKKICFRLTQDRLNPEVVGLGSKQDTPVNIMKALLNLEVDDMDSKDEKLAPNSFALNEYLLGCRRIFDWRGESAESLFLSEPSLLVRFVVYSYVLSKYKQFIMTENGLGCRLQPQIACEEGLRLIKPFWNRQNKDYRQPTQKAIKNEFHALQAWLSQLGCVWLKSLSPANVGELLHVRLAHSSIQTSVRGLYAAACFPAFLLLRDLWAESRPSLVIVDRFFCLHGCHYHLLSCEIKDIIPNNQRGMPLKIQWELIRTDITALAREKNKVSPCLVFLGNSIHGNNTDYIGRVLDTEKHTSLKKVKQHNDPGCNQFKRHSSRLGAADLDQVLLASFGAHKSYCIPRKAERTESEDLDLLFSGLGSGRDIAELRKMWKASQEAINELGAGPDNLEVFRLQHIFSETKFGLSQLIQAWTRDDNLSPLPVW